jgi:ubiquinone/menaquinone biosynthesis C-methylase UbiE
MSALSTNEGTTEMTNQTNAGLNRRRHVLPEMEGVMARWYARQRGTPSQLALYREQAAQLTAGLPNGATVLEVAPGPGYLAIEVAKLGRFQVTGLDISRTMVEIARENVAGAGVAADLRHGDATAMPFADGSFDLIVCQAAFKNFRRPVSALDEMHRVLRPGGLAVIQDMRKEATTAEIDREIRSQELGAVNGFITRRVLAGLRNRAFSAAQLERLVAESLFSSCAVHADGIGLEVRLRKGAATP